MAILGDTTVTKLTSLGNITYGNLVFGNPGTLLPGAISTTSTSGTDRTIVFGIGSGGENRGIYDVKLNKWMVYASDSGITLNGTADNANKLGNTAAASYAKLASPTFTGTPAAPTAAVATDTTQIATTAYVKDCIPKSVGSATKPVYTNANGVVTVCTYELNASVPSGAKFTDTTYSNMTAATASAAGTAGLVPAPAAGKQTSFLRGDGTWVIPTDTKVGSDITLTGYAKPSSTSAVAATDTVNAAIGKLEKALDSKQASGSYLTAHQTIKQNGVTGATGNCYGACTTAAATAAKVVTITAGTPTLEAGLKVTVKFNNANTASTPTLNVNSLGAKNIFHKGAKITTGANKALLAGICDFVYDGTQFHLVGNYIDTAYTHPSDGANTGSFGPSADVSPSHGGTFSVPYLTVNAAGHVTAVSTKTITLPADSNTDTKVTNTLGTTTKFFVTGTTSTTTATGTQYFDTGVYVTATAGNLYATTFNTGGNITMGGTSGTSYIQLPSGIKLY